MKQYTFHAQSLELREQASMMHPHDWLKTVFREPGYDEYCEQYEQHIASLRTITCSPQCREVWKDQQSVKDGDFEERHCDCRKGLCDLFNDNAESDPCLLAYPIQKQEQSYPEFSEWIKSRVNDLDKAGDGYEGLSELSKKCIDFAINRYLKQYFQITRRKQ